MSYPYYLVVHILTFQFFVNRVDHDEEEVTITEEKSAEQVSAEELKKRKLAEMEEDDGVVCLE